MGIKKILFIWGDTMKGDVGHLINFKDVAIYELYNSEYHRNEGVRIKELNQVNLSTNKSKNKTEMKFYKNGKKHGNQIEYYENGQTKLKTSFSNDKRHGEQIEYYESGAIGIKSYFNNGEKHDKETIYSENGIIQEKYFLMVP